MRAMEKGLGLKKFLFFVTEPSCDVVDAMLRCRRSSFGGSGGRVCGWLTSLVVHVSACRSTNWAEVFEQEADKHEPLRSFFVCPVYIRTAQGSSQMS